MATAGWRCSIVWWGWVSLCDDAALVSRGAVAAGALQSTRHAQVADVPPALSPAKSRSAPRSLPSSSGTNTHHFTCTEASVYRYHLYLRVIETSTSFAQKEYTYAHAALLKVLFASSHFWACEKA